jgi:outer membrane protein
MPWTHRAAAATSLWLFAATAAHAQPPADGLEVTLGLGAAPDYLGSDDYVAAPLPGFQYRRGDVAVRSNNLGVEAKWSLGPASIGAIARLDPGRNDLFDVKDRAVKRLGRVKAAAEVGALAEAAFPLGEPGGAMLVSRISLVRRVSDSDGWLVEASAGPLVQLSPELSVAAFVSASVQSDGYADTFFSVDGAGAARSGLRRFKAGGGCRDVGVLLLATGTVSERVAVSVIASYTRLQGDARRSPIVSERGAAGQRFAGVSLTYRFGR